MAALILVDSRKLPRLSADEVHLWQIELKAAPTQLAQMAASLSQDERQRANRFVKAGDKERFIIAHCAMRHILANYLNVEPNALTYIYNAQGKPGLAACPLNFNLSHSHERALFALSYHPAVGVDIEYMENKLELSAIADLFFTSQENKYLQAAPQQQKIFAFYQGWTRKEAFIKAKGLGLSYPIQALNVCLDTKLPGEEVAMQGYAAQGYKLFALPACDNYAAALAVSGTLKQIYFSQWQAIGTE